MHVQRAASAGGPADYSGISYQRLDAGYRLRALDPVSRMPEFKACAVRIEPA